MPKSVQVVTLYDLILFIFVDSFFRATVEMIIIFVLVLVSIVHSYPSREMLYSKDLSNSIDEVYGSYYTLSGKKNHALNSFQKQYLDKILAQQEAKLSNLMKPSKPESGRVERTAYLHIKTQQKNKRYASYLTLCHFKICNMGRKRTTRYFHVISSLDNGT